jgi:hypothetical protein
MEREHLEEVRDRIKETGVIKKNKQHLVKRCKIAVIPWIQLTCRRKRYRIIMRPGWKVAGIMVHLDLTGIRMNRHCLKERKKAPGFQPKHRRAMRMVLNKCGRMERSLIVEIIAIVLKDIGRIDISSLTPW